MLLNSVHLKDRRNIKFPKLKGGKKIVNIPASKGGEQC